MIIGAHKKVEGKKLSLN